MSAEDCNRRDYGRSSFVCVCNATYCDTAPSVGALAAGQAVQITSSQSAARFQTANLQFGRASSKAEISRFHSTIMYISAMLGYLLNCSFVAFQPTKFLLTLPSRTKMCSVSAELLQMRQEST